MRLTATDSERRLQEEIRAFLAAERPDAARLPRSLERGRGVQRMRPSLQQSIHAFIPVDAAPAEREAS